MNSSSVQAETAIHTSRRSTGTRLHGPWLILARGLWIILGLLAVRNFVVSLIVYAERLPTLCISGPCVLGQLSPESAHVLPRLGLSLSSYATLMIAYAVASGLICLGVGAMLFWRKSDDWMVLLVASMLVARVGDTTALALNTPAWLVSSISVVASVTLGLVFTLFPDGRFVPRWMRWLMIGWILLAICFFFNDAPFGISHWPILLRSALDDLGLLGALREQMNQYRSSEVALTLEAPEQLPPLSAAVEVACYRIAQEALTNVMRHASAHSCTLRLTLADMLTLEITDDGTGLPPGRQAGVGLTSMRERATELGGTCIVEPVPGGGTRVYARLPLS